MSIRDRIKNFDFDSARPYDLAVLLEQVFMHHRSGLDGGPLITAENVLTLFQDAVKRRSSPEMHSKMHTRLRDMRGALVQMESTLRCLEKDASSRSDV